MMAYILIYYIIQLDAGKRVMGLQVRFYNKIKKSKNSDPIPRNRFRSTSLADT